MKTSSIRLLPVLVASSLTLSADANDPAWWSKRNAILVSSSPPETVAVQGQAKHVAFQAYRELEEMLAPLGGAGPAIRDMVASEWFNESSADTSILRIGQLKTMAAPFYRRMAELNITPGNLQFHASLPWDVHLESAKESENAIAVLGQIKHVFSFDLDTDADEIADWWERRHWGNLDQAGSDDSDDDGVANAEEFKKGTNPLSADTDGDGHLDSEDEDPLVRGQLKAAQRPDTLELFTPMLPHSFLETAYERAGLTLPEDP